jgi:hypothetical protein
VRERLARLDCRIELHFFPRYCPSLNAAEQRREGMHTHASHDKCHAQVAEATNKFRPEKGSPDPGELFYSVNSNFCIVSPEGSRVAT